MTPTLHHKIKIVRRLMKATVHKDLPIKELYYRSEGFVHTIRWSEGIIDIDPLTISEGIILYIRRNYT